MFRRKVFSVVVGLAAVALQLSAGSIEVDLVSAGQTGAPGDTLAFLATLTNLSGTDVIYLNGMGSTASSPFLSIDISPFFSNAPLFLNPGDVSGPFELFDVTIDPAAPDGGYPGSFVTLEGGPDGGAGTAFDDLADVSFDVDVQSPTSAAPEPRTFAMLLISLGLLLWRGRKIKRTHAAVCALLAACLPVRAQVNWVQRFPAASPSPREAAAMVYDRLHQNIVLFGGSDAMFVPLSETWIWNGTNWTQAQPATVPAGRYRQCMTYDATHQVVLMFGGVNDSGNLSDTWIWDGTNWTQKSPAHHPSLAQGCWGGLAYDELRQQAILVNIDDTDTFTQTWLWDGNDWTQVSTNTVLHPTSSVLLTYDRVRQQVVLQIAVNNGIVNNTTYAWNGADWVQFQGLGNTTPLSANAAQSAFDLVHQEIVENFQDWGTQVWNGSSWRQIATANAPQFDRILAAEAYDDLHQQIVQFAGSADAPPFVSNETWTFGDPFPGISVIVPAGVEYTFNSVPYTGPQTIAIAPGPYPLMLNSPQLVAAGTEDTFVSWSDGGAQSHSVTIGNGTTVITGTFKTQFELTTGANPPTGGSIALGSSEGPGPFFDPGTVVTATATPSVGATFTSWSGACTVTTTTCQVTMSAPKTLTANFSQNTFLVTINVPAGISYTLSGFPFTGPGSLSLPAGSYPLTLASPQSTGAGVQAAWVSWSDGGAQSHSITVVASPVTVTGTFKTQYLLTLNANPANEGAVMALNAPASAPFYDAGSAVVIQASANTNFEFDFWSGGCTGSNPSCLVVITAPVSVTANFAQSVIWAPLFPANSPTARQAAAMAYDSVRQETVLFGGVQSDGTDVGDTWVWNGTTWTQKNPATSPPARSYHSMAYDAARQQVVLFSGDSTNTDTWVWDGAAGNWTKKNPLTSPPGREAAAMAYDTLHQQVVLFGGFTFNGYFSDTWVWDGSNWTQKTPAASPSARSGDGMAYDAARQQVVLFGGAGPTGLPGDTWVWDGATWTHKSPVVSPTPRSAGFLAYDALIQQTVFFGGFGTDSTTTTWLWDGTNWTPKSYAVTPTVRSFAGAAYDAARLQAVLFGGIDSRPGGAERYNDDTWVYANNAVIPPQYPLTLIVTPPGSGTLSASASGQNGPNYFAGSKVQVTATPLGGYGLLSFSGDCTGITCTVVMNGPKSVTGSFTAPIWAPVFPSVSPSPRLSAGTAYDSARQQTVLFGGITSQGTAVSDTWTWNGTTWTQMFPATVPPARQIQAMAYDSVHQQTVMFGGLNATAVLSDTWVWDGTNWTQKHPAHSPAARWASAVTYDPVREQVVLFGGTSTTNLYSDTWLWDGNDWTGMNLPGPPPLSFASMTFDAARQQTVLFGGSGAGLFNFLDGTWLWDGSAWTQATPAVKPPARSDAVLAYDALMQQVVLFGGDSLVALQVDALQDTWLWDGANWTQKSLVPSPYYREDASMAYDEARRELVLFGGGGLGLQNDTWVFSLTRAIPPQYQLTVAAAPSQGGTVQATNTVGQIGPNYYAGTPLQVTATPAPGYELEYWSGACSGFSCNVVMDANKTTTANFAKAFTFVQVFPSASPTPAPTLTTDIYGQHPLVYDSARQQIVMFGDAYGGALTGNQTWVWNGATWIQKTPAHTPPTRAGHGMAYDSVNNLVVLFGGADTNGNPLADTWVWDGTDWTQKPVAGPPARLNHGMAWDGQHIVLFGGWNVLSLLSDTWLWDGTAWTKSSAPGPAGRSDFGMAYDPVRGQVVLFGGYDALTNDTWIWNGTSWSMRTPATAPPAGFNAMAFDALNQQMVVFAEGTGTLAAPQMWAWDGTSWIQRLTSQLPSKRFGAGLAYDAATQQLVLFGGYVGLNLAVLSDTWVWLPPSTNLVQQAPTIAKDAGGNFLVTVTLANSGNIPLNSLQVNTGKLGSTTTTTFTTPAVAANVVPGGTVSFTAKFPPATGASGAQLPVIFTGTYSTGVAAGAQWTASARQITLP